MNDYLKTKELYHFGIKGMKWGIRKEDPQESEKNKAAKEKVREILQTVGATLAIASTAVAIYAQLHGFKDIGGKKKG